MRRPDPVVVARLHQLSARSTPAPGPAAAPRRAGGALGSAVPLPGGLPLPAEPWDLDAWPDVPPSLADWPVAPDPPERTEWPASRYDPWPEPAEERRDASEALTAAASEPVPAASVLHWAPPPGLAEHVRAALLSRVPSPLRGARWDPGRRGAIVVAAAGVLAVVVACAFVLHGRSRPVAAAGTATRPAAGSAAPAVGALPGASDPLAGGLALQVDVEGRVRHPGLVQLPVGSRVAQALTAAGGVVPGTDTSTLDLAAKVTDGQQLRVGPGPVAAGTGTGTRTAGTGTSVGMPGAPGTTAPLDLNAATADQLDGLPHVGPATAAKIIAWRTAHGPFTAVSQLQQVAGIGPSTYQDIAPLVTV